MSVSDVLSTLAMELNRVMPEADQKISREEFYPHKSTECETNICIPNPTAASSTISHQNYPHTSNNRKNKNKRGPIYKKRKGYNQQYRISHKQEPLRVYNCPITKKLYDEMHKDISIEGIMNQAYFRYLGLDELLFRIFNLIKRCEILAKILDRPNEIILYRKCFDCFKDLILKHGG